MATSTEKLAKTRRSSIKKTVKDQSGAGRIKVGELLSKAGYITATQFETAKKEVQKNGTRMSAVLRQLEYIDENTVFNFLSRHHNYIPAVIKNEPPSPDAIKLMPYELAKEYLAFPLRLVGNTLQITMAEPSNAAAVEELQDELKKELSVCVSTENDIIDAYKKYYGIDDEEARSLLSVGAEESEEELSITEVDDFGAIVAEAADDFEIEADIADDGLDQFAASDAPIIKLVNGILVKAVQDQVSDVHIEPYERSMQVRYRKDGSLFKSMNLPLTIKNAMTARVKILAGLDITERRVPQDGRIKMRLGKNRAVDFRVSSLPTLYGESVVLRILDKSALNVDLTQLGFEQHTFEMLKRCLARPQGMLLVTGPTGSGKTTTLYAALSYLNTTERKIITVEDPVEYNIDGINQIQVKPQIGLSFANALRSIVRQDPDVIMIGEMRDTETAKIAVQSALTGHLVLSTLHTNDSAGSITRMLDMGVEDYLLASTVNAVMAQRLVRNLCHECRQSYRPSPEEIRYWGLERFTDATEPELYRAVGCEKCGGTGYRGRSAIVELMVMTDPLRRLVLEHAEAGKIAAKAAEEGMRSMFQDGLVKALAGITSIEELVRVTQED